MALASAVLILLLAGPARADCPPPSGGDDPSTLVKKIGRCFPDSEAAQVKVLNMAQRYSLDRDSFVKEFADYILDHDRNPQRYVKNNLGQRAEYAGNGRIDPANVVAAAALAAAIYDKQNGSVPTPSATPRTGSAEKTGPPTPQTPPVKDAAPTDARRTVAPPSVKEDIVVGVAREIQDAGLQIASAGLAAERHDYAVAYERFSAVPQDPNHPNADAQLGAADAAYQAGDFAAARAAAKAALKARPGDKSALAILHFSDGRVPTVNLRGVASGFAAAPAAEGGPRGGAAPARSAAAPTAAAPPAGPPPAGAGLDPRAAHEDESAATALKLGDLDAAVAHAARAVALDPRDEHALLYRSAALGRQGRWAGAENDAARALALAPDDPAALLAHIAALEAQGRWEEALADADRLARVDGGRGYAHRARARILARLRDRPGALAALKRAAEVEPSLRPLYERAVQLPQDQDLSLVFAGGEAAPAAPPAPSTPARAARVVAGAAALAAVLVAAVLLARRRRAAAAADPARLHGRYEVVRRIGTGGMGVVDEARDLALGRRVAIKRIRAENSVDPRERERFIQEARAVARLKHPGIVQVYEVYEDGSDACVVFEFIDGRTLSEVAAAKKGGLGFPAALGLLRPVCEATAHAHAAGLVHRDLKPANMMVDAQGRVKVMDFGAARALSATVDDRMTSTIIGTPPYMAPEQEEGVVRRESDVYALAVSLYEIATGRFPFAGAGAALTQKKREGKPLPAEGVADVPPGFDAAMAAALAPDPEKRPRTPADLLAVFEALNGARA